MNPLPLRAISNFNNALLDQQFDEAAIQMAIIETNNELRHEFVNAQPDYPLHDALREGAPVALIARITKLGRPESLNENRAAWNWLANRTINNSSDAPIEARVQEYAEIAKHFIDAGIGTDNLVERRWHAAHILISHLGNVSPATAIELLDYLRSSDAGFTLNSVDEIGETPLHLALWHLNFPIATYLIEHGADVNASTVGGLVCVGVFVPRHRWQFAQTSRSRSACVGGYPTSTKIWLCSAFA